MDWRLKRLGTTLLSLGAFGAGEHKHLYLGGPQFEGCEVVQQVK